MSHPILALVGASGVGKTTLLLELLKRMPERVFPIVILTNRARRGPEDDIFCRFVDAETIRRERDAGNLVHYLEYGGNVYGCTKADVAHALERGIALQAYTESGIQSLLLHGYDVAAVKIVADVAVYRDAKRVEDDKKRAETPIEYQLVLENSFAPGGLEKAVQKLMAFVEAW